MGTVDEYVSGLDEPRRSVVGRLYAAVTEAVPEAEQGKGYGMPALVYRGKPLVSVMATKRHLSLFPFSGDIVEQFTAELDGFDTAKGTIRFQPEAPLPSDLAVRIVEARRTQIDG
ncbi:iron chaperone [Mumia sp. Pv 4-285]|uniref:iron chaperone n=1 Tax=Mumia qirimensis TaxID=3234852 RepID=UPI00351D6146